MKPNPKSVIRSPGKTGSERAVRPAIQIAVWIVGLACLGMVMVVHVVRQKADQRGKDTPLETTRAAQQDKMQRPAVARSTAQHPFVFAATTASSRPTPGGQLAYSPKPTPAVQQLINGLVHLDLAGGGLTEDQAGAWKENFQHLVQQGDSAVAAINEFLAKNTDVAFGSDGGSLLGYASARAAMIGALMQIEQGGSSLAMVALDSVLQDTANPQEIAQVAQFLEKTEPGVFQQDALAAARRTLAMAANGDLAGRDTAPLFEVLEQYGGSSAVSDLEQGAKEWNYYAAMALAQLPDGAGISTLVQMAGGTDSGARTAAIQMLAQVALQSQAARDALMGLAREGRILDYDWAALAPLIAGNQMVYHNAVIGSGTSGADPRYMFSINIPASNQQLSTIPVSPISLDQINQLKTFINDLSQAVTSPVALKVLQDGLNQLDEKSQVASTSAAPTP